MQSNVFGLGYGPQAAIRLSNRFLDRSHAWRTVPCLASICGICMKIKAPMAHERSPCTRALHEAWFYMPTKSSLRYPGISWTISLRSTLRCNSIITCMVKIGLAPADCCLFLARPFQSGWIALRSETQSRRWTRVRRYGARWQLPIQTYAHL